MYADKDSRGLVSIFELDRPERSALRGGMQMATYAWTAQLAEFDGLKNTSIPVQDLQRKLHLEQCVAFARKLTLELDRADETDAGIPSPFQSTNQSNQ